MAAKFTSENFDQEVLETRGLVVVDFYADWCGPCKMMAPVLDKLEEENSQIKVGKLNIDNSPEIAERYSVMTIPTIMFFYDGQLKDKTIGVVPKSTLENIIRNIEKNI